MLSLPIHQNVKMVERRSNQSMKSFICRYTGILITILLVIGILFQIYYDDPVYNHDIIAQLPVTHDISSSNPVIGRDFYNITWDKSLKEAYSIWYLPPPDLIPPYKRLIDMLADEFNGTHHYPHVTLFGPIYIHSTNLNFLIERTETLSSLIPSMRMIFRNIDIKRFHPVHRFRGGATIRYHHTADFMNASILAANMFHNKLVQYPHLSLLYDHNANSEFHRGLNETIIKQYRIIRHLEVPHKNMYHVLSPMKLLSWTSSSIALVYTPMRDHFIDVRDIQDIIHTWKVIKVFPLTGKQLSHNNQNSNKMRRKR